MHYDLDFSKIKILCHFLDFLLMMLSKTVMLITVLDVFSRLALFKYFGECN